MQKRRRRRRLRGGAQRLELRLEVSLLLFVGKLGELEEAASIGGLDAILLREGRVFANGLVNVLHDVFEFRRVKVFRQVLGKMLLILFRLFLLHLFGVFRDDTTLDVSFEGIGVVRLVLKIVAGEALFVVRDIQTTVDGTLERGKNASTSARANQTSIQEALERARLVLILVLHVVILAEFLRLALVRLREVVLCQQASRAQQTRGVRRRVVGQTSLHAVLREFMRVRRSDAHITRERGVNHLANHIPIGKAHHEAVLWRVVLVLVLRDQALTRLVVGFTRTSSRELDLVSRVVRRRL
mmetsp:Transcript_5447/g.12028  ORF Transcript_5447/g.12028 Transcript_5447/m.12028 type:complete len:298 (+) Transcript_5447:100-993(+)